MYQVPLEMICRHDRTAEVCRAAVEEDIGDYDKYLEDLTLTYVDAIKGLPTQYNDFVAHQVVELKGWNYSTIL